eukprot:m.8202 g.8202  ORF g.8202 m.8202 type:complete len:188 (-) comp6129_c0_seq2:249-812(-)
MTTSVTEVALKPFALVVAATKSWGIGKGGTLPWTLKGDMAYFKRVTLSCADPDGCNAVIMGRKTWESIPKKFRPLAGRFNIVLTRSPADLKVPDGVLVTTGLPEALSAASQREDVKAVFIIGGASIYEQALTLPQCKDILLTVIDHDFECDTVMPAVDESIFARDVSYGEAVQEGDIAYEYRKYSRK